MTVTEKPHEMSSQECGANSTVLPLTGQDVWPGERMPQSSDAELAYQALDPTIIAIFKQALATEVKRYPAGFIDYSNKHKNDSKVPLDAAEAARRPLAWPEAVLPSDSLLREDSNISNLILICAHKFVSRAPFLCDRPMTISSHSPRPLYLRLALACIGSLMAGEPEERSTSLWLHSIRRLVGQLELDNREARKMNLTRAWILLETFGLLSADRAIWKRTSIAHGHVETATWRLLSDSAQLESNDTAHENNKSIIAYFMLIDLLRAIHFGQPATLVSSEALVNFSLPKPGPSGRSLESLQTSNLETTMSSSLHQLTVILGMIHTIATLFHPMLKIEVFAPLLQPNRGLYNPGPRIPLSPSSEMIDTRNRVRGYLQAWQQQYYEQICSSKDAAIALLFHFCHMYLAFPDLQALVELSGYPPRQRPQTSPPLDGTTSDIAMRLVRQIGSYDGKVALQHAWKILDIESDIIDPAFDSIGSIWTPLVLFYTCLLVWADVASSPQTAFDASRPILPRSSHFSSSVRVLDLFQARLKALRAPCCHVMTALIDRLKSTRLTSSGDLNKLIN